MTDADVIELTKLRSLRRLALRNGSRITPQGAKTLGQMASLNSLEVRGCKAIGDLDFLSSLKLTSLALIAIGDLHDSKLSDLAKLTELKELDLSNNSGISDQGLARLAEISKLRIVNLSACAKITDSGLMSLARYQELVLDKCESISGIGLDALRKANGLRKLSLRDCRQLKNSDLGFLAHCRTLQSLDLSGCTELDEAGLKPLEGEMLQTLLVGHTRIEGNELARFQSLLRLDLSHCPINEKTFAAIGSLKKLKVLVLDGCEALNDVNIRELRKLEALQYLSVRGCGNISLDAIDSLSRERPDLEIEMFEP